MVMSIRVTGISRAVAKLNKLEPKVRRRILVKALSAGGGTFKDAAKSKAPKETGLLGRSLGVKRTKTKERGAVAYRVAPRKNWKRAVQKTKAGKLRVVGAKRAAKLSAQGVDLKTRDPQRYAHFVELGRRGAKPSHFMKRTFRAKRNTALKRVTSKIREGVRRAAAKR